MRQLDDKIQEYSAKFQQSYDEYYRKMAYEYEVKKQEARRAYYQYMSDFNNYYAKVSVNLLCNYVC